VAVVAGLFQSLPELEALVVAVLVVAILGQTLQPTLEGEGEALVVVTAVPVALVL
jgi:hypothetical protein